MFQSEYISCRPISNVDDLLNWPMLKAKSRQYRTEKIRPDRQQSPSNSSRFLVCHDMMNNYLQDKYFQGWNDSNCFNFYHWNLIDTFVYFSHHLVTIPPESWINAAHENNVRILGTFISEFSLGEHICRQLFETIDLVIEILIDMTIYYGFDGWLLNIENKIDHDDVDKLKYFVRKLHSELKRHDPNLRLIWYDSVTDTGELNWQNELNQSNKVYFDLCDGIFLNYTWKIDNLERTRLNALDRNLDVYVGIDVFGRGCMGDGGFNCNIPLKEIVARNLSVALFAPGWVFECLNAANFVSNNEIFWNLMKDSVQKRKITELPLVTSFTVGRGEFLFVNGKKYPNSAWNDNNLQSLVPFISSVNVNTVSWHFEDAFYGGNSILIKSKRNVHLFDFDIELNEDKHLTVEYVFKDDGFELFSPNQFQSNMEKFYLVLDYVDSSNRLESSKKLKLSSSFQNVFSDFELVKYFDQKHSTEWRRRLYTLKLKANVRLLSVTAFNDYEESAESNVKLGFLSIVDNDQQLIRQNSSANEVLLFQNVDIQTQVFSLENQIYLCVKLRWNRFIDVECKYYNVFLDLHSNVDVDEKNSNSEPTKNLTTDLQFIGSTKREIFFMCAKIDQALFYLDKTLENKKNYLSFNVIIQSVDRCLRCLDELNQIDHENLESFKTIKLVNIQVPKLKKKETTVNHNSRKYIDRLIYDYEYFN